MPAPPTQPAMLRANATSLAVLKVKRKHAWILHGEKEDIFMNIIEQSVTRNLNMLPGQTLLY